MIDKAFLIEQPDLVRANCVLRGFEPDVITEIIEKESVRKKLIRETEDLRGEIKLLSKTHGVPSEETRRLVREKRDELKRREYDLAETNGAIDFAMSRIPNLTSSDVPNGDESANQVIRQVGTPPNFTFTPKPHHTLGEDLGVIDIVRAVKISGSGFYFLKNELAMIRNIISMAFLERLRNQGFHIFQPPVISRALSFFGTGYFPFAEKDNYRIEGTDTYLTGTSEQVLVSQHFDEVLKEDCLPLLYAADSACFRTEAGSYGQDSQGIIRVHQFHKVEQIVFCHPSESESWQEKCLENEEWLLKELGIPYQVVVVASRDMGAPGYKKYDIEGWIPSQGRFRELTSNTNLTDFQTRRLKIRVKPTGAQPFHPHTISATGFSDRLLVCILENFQHEDGSVELPNFLATRLGGLKKLEPISSK